MLTQAYILARPINIEGNDKDPKIQSKNDPSKCSSLVVEQQIVVVMQIAAFNKKQGTTIFGTAHQFTSMQFVRGGFTVKNFVDKFYW